MSFITTMIEDIRSVISKQAMIEDIRSIMGKQKTSRELPRYEAQLPLKPCQPTKYMNVDERRAMLEGGGYLSIYAIMRSEDFDRRMDAASIVQREHYPHTIELTGTVRSEFYD